MHPVTKQYLKEIKLAIKQFGEEQYYDKGPEEIMDVKIEPMAKLPKDEKIIVFQEINDNQYGQTFSECLLGRLEETDISDDELAELQSVVECDIPHGSATKVKMSNAADIFKGLMK